MKESQYLCPVKVYKNQYIAWAAATQLVVFNIESSLLELDVDCDGHSDAIRSIAFHPDGSMVVTAGEDKKVFLWRRTDTFRWEIACTFLHAKKIMSVEFLNDSEIIFGDKFGDFFKISLQSNQFGESELMFGHLAAVSAAIYSRSRSLLVSADRDEKIRLTQFPKYWNIGSFLFGHRRYVSALSFTDPDEHTLVSAGADGVVALWDIANTNDPKQVWSLQLEEGSINAMAVTADGEVLAIRTEDPSKILRIRNGVVHGQYDVAREAQAVVALANGAVAVVDDMSHLCFIEGQTVKISKDVAGLPVSLMKFVHHENLDGNEYGERKRQKNRDE